jgi:hypothetical protein
MSENTDGKLICHEDGRVLCKDCEIGDIPKLLDRDGVLSSLSGEPGTWCHAHEEFYWPCPARISKRYRDPASEQVLSRIVDGGKE